MIQQSCPEESVMEGTVFPFLFEKILASFSKMFLICLPKGILCNDRREELTVALLVFL